LLASNGNLPQHLPMHKTAGGDPYGRVHRPWWVAREGFRRELLDRPRQAPGPVVVVDDAGVLTRSRQPKTSWIGTSRMSEPDANSASSSASRSASE
jgi:hypothetical protein